MKTRNGFVSNSSSSSFVISIPKEIKPVIKMEITVDIKDYTDKVCKTEEELKEYLFEWNCVDSLEELQEESKCGYKNYIDGIEEIKKGNWIYFGSCSDEDEGLSPYLCYNGFSGISTPNVKVIENCDGF